MPPDKHWKKVKERYEIEKYTRLDGRVVTREGTRYKWVEDESKKGKRCINHFDATEDQAKCLLDKIRREKAGAFIKTEKELGSEMAAEVDREVEKHALAMEELKRERFSAMQEIEELKKLKLQLKPS
jgi:hypothetical protein